MTNLCMFPRTRCVNLIIRNLQNIFAPSKYVPRILSNTNKRTRKLLLFYNFATWTKYVNPKCSLLDLHNVLCLIFFSIIFQFHVFLADRQDNNLEFLAILIGNRFWIYNTTNPFLSHWTLTEPEPEEGPSQIITSHQLHYTTSEYYIHKFHNKHYQGGYTVTCVEIFIS